MLLKKDIINKLVEEYLKLLNSTRNRRLKSYWIEKPNSFGGNMQRGDEPKKYKETGSIPIIVNPVEAIYAHLFNYSLKDYYSNPDLYLEMFLKQRITQFTIFMDDSPLRKEIPISMGTYYEMSIFGAETIFNDTQAPMAKFNLVIKDENDLEKFENINFDKAGLVPLAIKFYDTISNYLEGTELKVAFPSFNRGPFGVLCTLMGYDKTLTNMMDNPDFIKHALKLINRVSISYNTWIRKNFNTEFAPKQLINDDVNCPSISPHIYKNIIFPIEKELEVSHERIAYWHSCGNCNDLLTIIKNLRIDVINVSAVGDLNKYTVEFKNNAAYEICVHPINDVLNTNEIGMSKKIDSIISICDKNKIDAYCIIASALEGTGKNNLLKDIKHIFDWINISRNKINNYIKHKEINE